MKIQRYRTLIKVYTIEELNKLEDWIEKIVVNSKVMEGFHKDIQWLIDQTQENILEVEKYYKIVCNAYP